MRNKSKLLLALFINIIFFESAVSFTIAAEPDVSIDESVYVNLDYYGNANDVSIVKGCSLNGKKEFIDYGKYESITNMTNYDKPQITDDGVKWNITDNADRFYYECKVKDDIVLPWNFDVSYKLNGVPKKGEELAGASGLVEINVECIPNENAKKYYSENMLLQTALMVNMEDALSVEAPGAQLQSMGTYKAVIFAALPGEHTTFTIRIGTNKFETSGIVMMMMPGTLEQLKNIKDLKEAKDKVKDSADAVYDSLDSILSTLENLSGGLTKTKDGLNDLEKARDYINNSKQGVYQNAEQALDDLKVISSQMSLLIPYMQDGERMIEEMNVNINNFVNSIDKTKSYFEQYSSSIDEFQANVEKYRKMLSDFDATKEQRQEVSDDLKSSMKKLNSNITGLNTMIGDMSESLDDLSASTLDFKNSLNHISITIPNQNDTTSSAYYAFSESAVPDMNVIMKMIMDAVDEKINVMIKNMNTAFNDVASNFNYSLDKSTDTVNDLTEFMEDTSDMLKTLTMVMNRTKEMTDSLQKALDIGDDYFKIIEDNYENTDDTLKQLNNIGDITKEVNELAVNIINDIDSLNSVFNNHKDSCISFLKQTEEITLSFQKGIDSTTEFLTTFKDFLKSAGNQINSGTEKTLNGFIDVIRNSLEGIDETPVIKNANETIKKTIDDEFDKFEDENKFLYLDTEMEMMSFTSEKNPSPESIQVILRTEEISIDDENINVDYEKESENIGILNRILNVFKKIANAFKSVFE